MAAAGTSTDAGSLADALVAEVLLTPEGRADPYPRYHRLREVAPVHRSALGPWVLTRYDDCKEVLRHPGAGKHPLDLEGERSFGPPLSPAMQERMQQVRRSSMLFLNPPEHTRLRGLVAREFTPRRVEALRPQIAAIAAPMLDHLAAAGEADLMDLLAFRLPVHVIGELLGVPPADREGFRSRVRAAVATLELAVDEQAMQAAGVAQDEMRGYFAELISAKRAAPGDDLLSALIAVRDGSDRLSEEELISTSILLFAAGFETTTNLIGNGVYALLRHPDELARVDTDRGLVPGAVEEILRWDSPVQLDVRYFFDDIAVGGTVIPAGATAITFLGAANRDPARFEDPDRFDVSRSDNAPLSFAWGIHHCLGAHLARAEGQEVVAGLLQRFARIELVEEPTWRPGLTLRGLERLDVRVTPR